MRRAFLVLAALAIGAGSIAPPAGAVRDAAAIAGDYRAVLARLAAGEVDAALDDLSALERRALAGRRSQRAVEALWIVKLRVIREIIEAQSLAVLVPIIVFHHEAAAGYRAEREPLLALHSRRMVDELADFYVKRAEDPDAEVFTGWVLSSLGGYVLESRSFSTGRQLLLRALEVDPANEFALLSVGVALEMHGRYEEAVEFFTRLVALRPDHAEGRLRLALCRLKAGMADEVLYRAVPELGRVANDGEAPAWVRSLAFQELAAHHLRRERLDEAEAWLRLGLEELPEDSTQRIQLAALLERRGRRREAQRLLAAIRPAPGGDSPRRRYDRVPTEGLEDGREAMRRMMAARLPLLSAGLDGAAARGAGDAVERLGE